MASGSINVNTSNPNVKGILNWFSTPIMESNSSDIQYELIFRRLNTGYVTYGEGDFYVTIDGTQHHKKTTFRITDKPLLIMSGVINLKHNPDGSKQVVFVVDGNTNVLDVLPATATYWLDAIVKQ